MTTIRQALQTIPWDLIAIIGRQNGLGIDKNLSKTGLIEKVIPVLLNADQLHQIWQRLSPNQKDSLTDLLKAQGRCLARHLTRRYGPIRPARQIIRAFQSQAHLSDLEQLQILGLIYSDDTPHQPQLFIPSDLVSHLQPEKNGRQTEVVSVRQPSSSYLFDHDLALLLGLLQRHPVRLLHRRWLSPAFLNEWGALSAKPPTTPHPRSELQTRRRRFLHYIAECAGLVSGPSSFVTRHVSATKSGPKSINDRTQQTKDKGRNHFLIPTPAAWLWLKAAPADRYQTLWAAWRQPDPDRWRVYRWPGHDWLTTPAHLLAAIHQGLITFAPTNPAIFAQTLLSHHLDLLDLVPLTVEDPAALLIDAIVEILTGPLVWLGILTRAEIRRQNTESKDNSAFRLHHSEFGYALLTDQSLPETPPPTKFTIATDLQPDPLASTFTFTPTEGLPHPLDLATLIEIADFEPSRGEAGERGSRETGVKQRLSPPAPSHPCPLPPCQVTAVTFARALHHGWSPPALLDALNRLAERPLAGPETALLRTWAKLANNVTIRQATVLEATEPDIITRLASTRRGRKLIQRTLSPRAVLVDPSRLDQLTRRLTEQEGVPPRVSGGAGERRGGGEVSPLLPGPSAPLLWLTVQLYQGLGRNLPLPVRIPQSVIDQLTALATADQLAAAESAAEQTYAALQDLIDGRAPFPPWIETELPLDEALTAIETALDTGQCLEIDYYAAGTDRLTHRVVEPYRLEWHGRGETVMQRGSGAGETGCGRAEETGSVASGKIEAPSLTDKSSPQHPSTSKRSDTPRLETGTPYLVGFCHLAQAERTFRVDRIQSIAVVTLEDSEDNH